MLPAASESPPKSHAPQPAACPILLNGKKRLIEADTIVLCTGQDSERGLATELDRPVDLRFEATGVTCILRFEMEHEASAPLNLSR